MNTVVHISPITQNRCIKLSNFFGLRDVKVGKEDVYNFFLRFGKIRTVEYDKISNIYYIDFLERKSALNAFTEFWRKGVTIKENTNPVFFFFIFILYF
jgi:hypothetical protein